MDLNVKLFFFYSNLFHKQTTTPIGVEIKTKTKELQIFISFPISESLTFSFLELLRSESQKS